MKKRVSLLLAICLVVSLALYGCGQSGASSGGESAAQYIRNAKTFYEEKNYGSALEAYQKALELDDANDTIYLGLADVYVAMGDTESAAGILRQGLDKIDGLKLRKRLDELTGRPEGSPANASSSSASSTPLEEPSAEAPSDESTPTSPHEGKIPSNLVQPDVLTPVIFHGYTTENLFLRTGPGQDYSDILKMPQGSMVEEVGYLEGNGEWMLVLYEGSTYGWAHTDYLNFDGGMAKPVVYLYPTQMTEVDVTVEFETGGFTCTYPDYGEGWSVWAWPDGKVVNKADGREYSYLYWEGEGWLEYDMSTGWVVKGEDTAAFLQHTLQAMGLTPREYNEFIVYWLPQMQKNAYNLITFQQEVYTDNVRLNVSPQPDSMLRVYMVYQPLASYMEVPAPEITPFERTGFAVVEWGGTVLSTGAVH